MAEVTAVSTVHVEIIIEVDRPLGIPRKRLVVRAGDRTFEAWGGKIHQPQASSTRLDFFTDDGTVSFLTEEAAWTYDPDEVRRVLASCHPYFRELSAFTNLIDRPKPETADA